MTWLKQLIEKLKTWWAEHKPQPDPEPQPEPDPVPGPTPGTKLRCMWLRDKNASWREMNLLGNKISLAQYKAEIDALVAGGINTHLVFVFNAKDGVAFGGPTNFYSGGFAGAVNDGVILDMRKKLAYAKDSGLALWLCPVPDDGGLPYDDMAKMRTHFSLCVSNFDDMANGWMLALEPEEYWSKRADGTEIKHMTRGQTLDMCAYLRTLTDRPIGIHGTSRAYDRAQAAPGCTHIIYQDKTSDSVSTILKRIKTGLSKTTKPWLCWECTRGNATDAHRLGLRAELDKMDRVQGTP